MSKKLILGALSVVAGVALATACSSSKKNGSGSGGSSGTAGSGGAATGGSGGGAGTDGGATGGSGGVPPYQDADLDAPYQLPDGGCGQVFCPAAVNAQCPNAFKTLNECSDFCKQIPSQCMTQWDALLTCAGPTPDISCDSNGQLVVNGCEKEGQAYTACVQPKDGGTE